MHELSNVPHPNVKLIVVAIPREEQLKSETIRRLKAGMHTRRWASKGAILAHTKDIAKSFANPTRILFVTSSLAPYMAACLKSVEDSFHATILVVEYRREPSEEEHQMKGNRVLLDRHSSNVSHRLSRVVSIINDFNPTVVLQGLNWRQLDTYVIAHVCRVRRCQHVGLMDNQWHGNAHQHFWAWFLRTTRILPVDAIWVPGERAAQYAKRLFRKKVAIWKGVYAANDSMFSRTISAPPKVDQPRANRFLFVGRLVKEKGVEELICAYLNYRQQTQSPWDLEIVGDGPLRSMLPRGPGIIYRGFLAQREVARAMVGAAVFIMPSRFEPWCVAIHEALYAGMPVLCSDSCGASVELVRHGYNGLVFRAGNTNEITKCMTECGNGLLDLDWFGNNSRLMALSISRSTWSRTLFDGMSSASNVVSCRSPGDHLPEGRPA